MTIVEPAEPTPELKQALRKEMEFLVLKYTQDRSSYETAGYPEAQVRTDFLNPFFAALGWDIENRKLLKPHLREVVVEKVTSEGRPDYSFRLEGHPKFIVEAKAPSESLDNVAHIMQVKAYAYSSENVTVAVLTNFARIKVYDASQRPDERHPELGLIFDLGFEAYVSELDQLWALSKLAVEKGSLPALLPTDPQSKQRRIPVDRAFLEDMIDWRTALAKDLYKRNHEISSRRLADVVQRILDRIVFIRMAEDRQILPQRGLFEIVQEWKTRGGRRPIQPLLNELFGKINDDLNGEVFKPHDCEREEYWFSPEILAGIIEGLYIPRSPYRFDLIGVEVLGRMYERYLGTTIRLTDQRVKIEEKHAALKSHGVYYTPPYVVKYIVKQTVARSIDGKTPGEIDGLAILDPACGSGSFLTSAFKELVDYHVKWYENHPNDAKRGTLFPNLIRDGDLSRVSIERKSELLRNCIFGVDVDPQAVEITMMSLYIGVLEGERTLPANKSLLPRLKDNIRVGDSLSPPEGGRIRQRTLDTDEPEASPYTDWHRYFPDIFEGDRPGFDVVLGNPPYVSFGLGRVGKLGEDQKDYYRESFPGSAEFKISIYALFVELAFRLLRKSGRMGYIIPDSFLTGLYFSKLRGFLLSNRLEELLLFDEDFWTEGSVGLPVILIGSRGSPGPHVRVAKVQAPNLNALTDARVDPATWSKNPAQRFRLLWTAEDAALCTALEVFGESASGVLDVHQGLNRTHRASEIADRPRGKSWKKCLADADCVRPFSIAFHDQFVDGDPSVIGGTRDELIVLEEPKLVFPRTGDDAYCAVDTVGYYPTNALIYATPKRGSPWDIHALATIVNSSTLRRYHQATTMKEGRVFPQIEVDAISHIPLPRIGPVQPGTDSQTSNAVASILGKDYSDETNLKALTRSLDESFGSGPRRTQVIHGVLAAVGVRLQAELDRSSKARGGFLRWIASDDGLNLTLSGLSGRKRLAEFDRQSGFGTDEGFESMIAVILDNEVELSGRKKAVLHERYRQACEQISASRMMAIGLRKLAEATVCTLYRLEPELVDYIESVSDRYPIT
jgi:hypothetical protein